MSDGEIERSSFLQALTRFSLLWPTATPPDYTKRAAFDPTTVTDLRIDHFIAEIAPSAEVRRGVERLLATPVDEATRAARRAILADFTTSQPLREAVGRLHERAMELQMVAEEVRERDILTLVRRLSDLELVVEVLDLLHAALNTEDRSITSSKLREFARVLDDARRDPQVAALRHALPEMRAGLRERRSVTVGINLDARLRPREAVLLSINDKSYTDGGSFDALGSAIFGRRNPYRARTTLHRNTAADDWLAPSGSAGTPESVPLAPLFAELDSLLSTLTKPLARALKRFNTVQVTWIRRLIDELTVCAAVAEYRLRLEAAGFSVCDADSTATASSLSVRGLYDPVLALDRIARGGGANDVRSSSVDLFHSQTTVLVTGPNDGGKTTFLRAVAHAYIAACAGLPVAARAMTLPAAMVGSGARVLTAFAAGESVNLNAGRFAAEAARVADVVRRGEPRSLLILNETFSSTEGSDALALAEELLDILRERDIRVVFATHLHELPCRLAAPPGGGDGLSVTAESVTIRPDRPYTVVPGLPDGRSLAREVARKAGLDLDALRAEGR